MSPDELAAAVSDQELRVLQLLKLALAGGAAFVVVGLVVLTQATPPQPEAAGATDQNPYVLSLAHAFLLCGALVAVPLLGRIRDRALGSRLQDAPPEQVPGLFLADHRTSMLIKQALLEGPALLGIGVVYIAHMGGALAERPELWVNLTSAAVLLGYTAATFPTREHLRRAFQQVVQSAPAG